MKLIKKQVLILNEKSVRCSIQISLLFCVYTQHYTFSLCKLEQQKFNKSSTLFFVSYSRTFSLCEKVVQNRYKSGAKLVQKWYTFLLHLKYDSILFSIFRLEFLFLLLFSASKFQAGKKYRPKARRFFVNLRARRPVRM